jgi:hypothetical protein
LQEHGFITIRFQSTLIILRILHAGRFARASLTALARGLLLLAKQRLHKGGGVECLEVLDMLATAEE